MYQLIGLPNLLKAYAFVTAAIAVVWGVRVEADLQGWMRCISSSAAMVGVLFYALGETYAFVLLCRYLGLDRWFPDIDGDWVGANYSNWPRIENRDTTESLPLKEVPAEVTFKARLFSIQMDLVSEKRYSDSKTISMSIRKVNGRPQLAYVYDNVTREPKPNDADRHFGAAVLDIIGNGMSQSMDGWYWTNRNWSKGQNTAGHLKLFRKQNKDKLP